MKDWTGRGGTLPRPFAETIPAVTVDCNPNGLPIASTQSPTLAESELPSFAAGGGFFGGVFVPAKAGFFFPPLTFSFRSGPRGLVFNRPRTRRGRTPPAS